MALADIHTSFGAGELSKNLYARVDLDKYHVGAALMRNFFTDYRGGASTRAGFEFIARTKSSGFPLIIPFQFSTTQTYVIELGELYARFYSNGAPIVDTVAVITGISQANPGVVTVAALGNIANGRTVVLAGIAGMTQLNGRTFLVAGVAGNTFTLQTLDGQPINTTGYGAWTSGGTASLVYEIAAPWHEADFYNSDGTSALKYAQSADVMTVTHPLYPPQLIKRLTPSTFSISPLKLAPVQAAPTIYAGVTQNSGNDHFAGYVVTAISPNGKEESLPSNTWVQACHSSTTGAQITIKWHAPPGVPPSEYKIYKWGMILETTSGNARAGYNSAFGYIGSALGLQFTDDLIAPDFTKGPPQFNDPFTPSQPTGVTVTAAGGAYANTSQPSVVFSGASLGRALLDDSGGVQAVTLDIPGTDPTHSETLTFNPNVGGVTANITGWTPDSGTYPSCCSYFQQRQCFGASPNQPQNFWASQVGNAFNFDQALIPLDSDAITLGLASRQVNQIKSMIPMPSGLVLMTSGGGWLLNGGGTGTPITPANTVAQPQASSGANDIPPLVVNNDIIYVQSRGATVRSLVFNFYVQSYFGTDRSLLANHLFFGHTLTSAAFAEEPFRLAHFTRDDGELMCMTYVPEQEIYAWCHYDTKGLFQWVTSVVEGQRDAVYVLTRRYINGSWKNFIERQASRNWQSQVEFCNCLDASLQLGQARPNATLTLSAPSGSGVTASVSAPVLTGTSADVGQVIRSIFGGKAIVTAAINMLSCTVNILSPFETVLDSSIVVPMTVGEWMMAKAVTQVQGLDHLAGQTVSALADGQVLTGLVVSSDGFVTLPNAASFVTVGYGFQCQLQTLYLDLGQPTVQSKRKLLPQVEVRLDDARGLKVGCSRAQFDGYMEVMKNPSFNNPSTPPEPLFSGDIMWTAGSDWTTNGQICCQQDDPVPASVLGLIAQVLVGDTQR